MANPKHLAILKQGAEAWDKWRERNPDIAPDLSLANLRGVNLCNANLCQANLSQANLIDTNLSGATLGGADLNRANLNGANLCGTNLYEANLSGAYLNRANLSHASMWFTIVGDTDLSNTIGLDTVNHSGPSSIGIDTLYRSQGRLPDKFLRDAGVPEEIIDIARSLRTGSPIQWNSCFISYSTKDEEFARRLHARMRQAGLRVWFAPEDMKGGDKLYDQIDRAIQLHDKLLLILSENSIQSEWVMTEIRKAREVEKKENRRKLFPIRLADFDTLRNWTCFDADTGKDLAVEVREYFIPDFSNWMDHNAFEAAFAKLGEDLKTEAQGTAHGT